MRRQRSLPSVPGSASLPAKKIKNNPMHSRNAFAERHNVHSASHCRVEQIGGKRAMAGDSAVLHRNSRRAVSLSAIEGKYEFRILRMPFDASGKTVAVCHHGPFESGTSQPPSATHEVSAFEIRRSSFHAEPDRS
ncbi:hypothetical protein [Bradyrhizobium sp. SSUT77]|uniref:hypothetical protein n=1 Tax=Bradyrhizobium sp. SSUT77 TaxID=3040603 RepID=UPI00244B3BA9|nr:hypothetical protein [Bradyrhizobium sp. SSUT77]MDH2346722.1 hypothetical protein [Bradyrhizobium sp. SSUT77]